MAYAYAQDLGLEARGKVVERRLMTTEMSNNGMQRTALRVVAGAER